MTSSASHRFLPIALVPSCKAESILVNVHTMAESIEPTDWRRIASDVTQVEDFDLVGDGFIGTVVAVGQNVPGRAFKAGDYVGGHVNGGTWLDTLDGANKAYLNIQPESLPVAIAKEFGVATPVTSNGCVIT